MQQRSPQRLVQSCEKSLSLLPFKTITFSHSFNDIQNKKKLLIFIPKNHMHEIPTITDHIKYVIQ